MAMHHSAKINGSGSYKLPITQASRLRVKAVVWPNSIIPASIIASEVLDVDLGLTVTRYPELGHDIHTARFMQIMEDAMINPDDDGYHLPESVAETLRVPSISHGSYH